MIFAVFERTQIRQFLRWVFVIGLTNSAVGAENPLSISVLKVERRGPSTYLLFSVENSSDQRFESTRWSCVFLNGENPVHEEESTVENVLRLIVGPSSGKYRVMAAHSTRLSAASCAVGPSVALK
jgi:hypothetical protein